MPDADRRGREMAAATVGKVRPTGAEPTLIRLLEDKAWQVRLKAGQARGQLGVESAIDPLGCNLASSISTVG